MVARTIHCTVVEVPAMIDPFCPPAGRDLVPWADPYIAALMEKLRHAMQEEASETETLAGEKETGRRDEWSPRDWTYDV